MTLYSGKKPTLITLSMHNLRIITRWLHAADDFCEERKGFHLSHIAGERILRDRIGDCEETVALWKAYRKLETIVRDAENAHTAYTNARSLESRGDVVDVIWAFRKASHAAIVKHGWSKSLQTPFTNAAEISAAEALEQRTIAAHLGLASMFVNKRRLRMKPRHLNRFGLIPNSGFFGDASPT